LPWPGLLLEVRSSETPGRSGISHKSQATGKLGILRRMADFLSTIFIGLVVGSVYALAGTGLVLTYRISGVFNFAQGAIGMFFAYVYYQLNQGGQMNLVFGHYTQTWKVPSVIAMVLVVVLLAPAAGWILDAVLL